MDDKTKRIVEKAQTKDTLEQEFSLTLEDRIKRSLELKPHNIIPNSHFAAVSAECFRLYRDGYYYGAISLSQSIAEALVKFLRKTHGDKPDKVFEKNLEKLVTRGFITKELAAHFNNIWKERDDYHHMNPSVEQDRLKLELLAKSKLEDLKKIEAELFAYSAKEGKLIPKFPKYWDLKEGKVSVFLRIN